LKHSPLKLNLLSQSVKRSS